MNQMLVLEVLEEQGMRDSQFRSHGQRKKEMLLMETKLILKNKMEIQTQFQQHLLSLKMKIEKMRIKMLQTQHLLLQIRKFHQQPKRDLKH